MTLLHQQLRPKYQPKYVCLWIFLASSILGCGNDNLFAALCPSHPYIMHPSATRPPNRLHMPGYPHGKKKLFDRTIV